MLPFARVLPVLGAGATAAYQQRNMNKDSRMPGFRGFVGWGTQRQKVPLLAQRFLLAETNQKTGTAKRIAVMSVGSRGDHQPIIALCLQLKARGMQVVFITNCDYVNADCADMAKSFGLDVIIGLENTPGVKDFVNVSKLPDVDKQISAFAPDMILAVGFARQLVEKLPSLHNVPLMWSSLWNVPTTLYESWGNGMEDVSTVLHWSPALSRTDELTIPGNVSMTGFLTLREDDQLQNTDFFGGGAFESLKQFIASGPPPVYVGWGSMTMPKLRSEQMAELVARALHKSGRRGVIVAGKAKLSAEMVKSQCKDEELNEYVARNLLFVPHAPHEWLLHQCAACVHHCGSGTGAAVLRAGVPSIIVPCKGDQMSNGRIAEASGCGVMTKPLDRVTFEEVADGIQRCLADKNMQARCQMVAAQLRNEDGVKAAVVEIERFMENAPTKSRWTSVTAKPKVAETGEPCPAGCGEQRATWHATHCCLRCEYGYGDHGKACARTLREKEHAQKHQRT